MRVLIVAALSALGLIAQTVDNQYSFYHSSSSSFRVTVQQAASPSKQISIVGASVYCPAACVLTVEDACTTPATSTAGTVNRMPSAAAATARVYTASNSASCTTRNEIKIAASETKSLTFPSYRLAKSATNGITFSTDTISGTPTIYIQWAEE